VLGGRHDDRCVRSLCSIKRSLDLCQAFINGYKLVEFTVHQQHWNMHLLPENEAVEISDFGIPTPQVGIFRRYRKPFIPFFGPHRPTCCFEFAIGFSAASDIEHQQVHRHGVFNFRICEPSLSDRVANAIDILVSHKPRHGILSNHKCDLRRRMGCNNGRNNSTFTMSVKSNSLGVDIRPGSKEINSGESVIS